MQAMTIDCDECIQQGTDTCGDCVVSFILGREAGEALVMDAEEARAVRLLSGAGLVPGLRHRRRPVPGPHRREPRRRAG